MIAGGCAMLAPLSEPAACVKAVRVVGVGVVLPARMAIAQRTCSLRYCPLEEFAPVGFEGIAIAAG